MSAQPPDARYWKPAGPRWYGASVAAFLFAWGEATYLPDAQPVDTFPYRVFLLATAALLAILWPLSANRPRFRRKLSHKAQLRFALGLLLVVWDVLSTKSDILPIPFFPGPAQIVSVMVREQATLIISAAYSMRLFLVGLLAGAALGLATGILTGWYRQWDYWLNPLIRLTGVIPSVAWMPIAIVVFPDSFTTGVFLITIASWFTVAHMVSAGIATTPRPYYEVARTLGAGRMWLLRHVAIPHALPSIFTGVITATGLSFLTLVISEMVGAKAGLGWYINWAKGWSAYDKVYAAIIIMAVAFTLILAGLATLRRRLLRWQRGIVKTA